MRSTNPIYEFVTHTHSLFDELYYNVNANEEAEMCFAYPVDLFILNNVSIDASIIPIEIILLFRSNYPCASITAANLGTIYHMDDATIQRNYSAFIVGNVVGAQKYFNRTRGTVPNMFVTLLTVTHNFIQKRAKAIEEQEAERKRKETE